VLVHGARPQIETEMKAKGLRSRYVRGLRVTDAAALTAVKHAAGALRVVASTPDVADIAHPMQATSNRIS